MSTKLSQKVCTACHSGMPEIHPMEAERLLKQLSTGWEIIKSGKWLHKAYKFGNFVEALAFVNKVGEAAEEEGHHPDIKLGWGYVEIGMQTHAIGGLHENDFILAAKIDMIPLKR